MSSKSIITHITPVGGNIFADLGFEPKEAARLLAETDQAISEKLAIKDRQAHSIVCPMKCPVCGAADLVHDTRDLSYTYKGESTMISSVTGDFCPACAESILGAAESERVMREIHAFNKQVNASIVDPEFIASVRKIKNHSLLGPVESERLERLAIIEDTAEKVFGSAELGKAWMLQKNLALGDTPLAMLDTETGSGEVMKVLASIAYGGAV